MEITVLRPAPVPGDAEELSVPMRDGVLLAADLYRAGAGAHPVVLVRLPYDKDGAYCFLPVIARYVTARGYTVVVQDVRGKFRSGGATEFGCHEVDDGADTIAWIAEQPWCSGDVVMWGDSYYGMTQLAAAAAAPPALRAIAPRLTGTRLSREVTYRDGTVDVEATTRKAYFAGWYVDRDAYEWPIDWTARPLRDQFEVFFSELGRRSVNFDAEFGEDRLRFQGPAVEQLLAAPPVPTLFTVGLYDNCAQYSWSDLDALLADERWRDAVHLRLEAIDHELNRFGEEILAFGEIPDLAPVLDPSLDFFDAVLAGRRDDVPRVFAETVHGEPVTAGAWPVPGTTEVPLFLGLEDGRPVLVPEAGDAATAGWRHDPADPVPPTADNPFARLAGRGGLEATAVRADVLHLEGPVAETAIDHLGRVSAEVFLESTATTTNLHARLLDVAPDGRHELVAKGQVHLDVVPADRPVCVDLLPIAHRLRPGHRWALQLMSSDFPEYVLEPGDGSDPWEATAFAASEQTVRVGGSTPSRLVLTRR
ncbi:CocE/NonD family hydrolase [Blastococcus sp. SYSU D00820]